MLKLLGLLLLVGVLIAWLWLRAAADSGLVRAGDKAPDFRLADQSGKTHAPSDYRGKWLALYFYPKDDTPGCTEEACAFRDDIAAFKSLGVAILGVSLDDAASHAAFARKHRLPFPLLADADGSVTRRYGALFDLKVLRFAKRHTFLIGPDGRVERIYRDVKPGRHAREIADDVRKLKKPARVS